MEETVLIGMVPDVREDDIFAVCRRQDDLELLHVDKAEAFWQLGAQCRGFAG